MDTEVPVVGGTIETEVDAKGNRRPGGVFGAAVEADLYSHQHCGTRGGSLDGTRPTLLACFCFNFSKIFCDCVFVASAILTCKMVNNRAGGYVASERVPKTTTEYWAPARKGPTQRRR